VTPSLCTFQGSFFFCFVYHTWNIKIYIETEQENGKRKNFVVKKKKREDSSQWWWLGFFD